MWTRLYVCNTAVSHVHRFSVYSPALAAELLELADQYMLDHLKQLCEARLTVSSHYQSLFLTPKMSYSRLLDMIACYRRRCEKTLWIQF